MDLGKFSFVWDDFHTFSADRFMSLLSKEEFTDVTLVSHDNNKIKAHKVILTTGCNFFKEVLADCPTQRPLIYL